MKHYDIIFSDIDGTFLNSDHQVTEKTKREVQRVTALGIPFVLSSSRMPEAILPVQHMAGIKQPMIAYGGSLILAENGDVLYSEGLETDKAYQVGQFVEKEFGEVSWNIYSSHKWLCAAPKSVYVIKEEEITGAKSTEGTLEEIHSWELIHKILCIGEPEMISDLETALKENFTDLLIAKSAPTYLEITSSHINKGEAMEIFCKKKGISIENTLVFGDNYNDLDMFQRAGTSYVMANAPEEIKQKAENLTEDHNNDGIASILSKLF